MHVENPDRLADSIGLGDESPLEAASAAPDSLAELRERWPARGESRDQRWWSNPGALSPRSALIELDVLARHARHALVACYGAPIRWTTPPADQVDPSSLLLRRCDPDASRALDDRQDWLDHAPFGQVVLAYAMEAGWDFAPMPEVGPADEWAAIVVPDECFANVEEGDGAPRVDLYFGTLSAFAVVERHELVHLWVARVYRRRGLATALVHAAGARRARGPFTSDGLEFARAAGLLATRSESSNGRG
jgi:hypothetical protein